MSEGKVAGASGTVRDDCARRSSVLVSLGEAWVSSEVARLTARLRSESEKRWAAPAGSLRSSRSADLKSTRVPMLARHLGPEGAAVVQPGAAELPADFEGHLVVGEDLAEQGGVLHEELGVFAATD